MLPHMWEDINSRDLLAKLLGSNPAFLNYKLNKLGQVNLLASHFPGDDKSLLLRFLFRLNKIYKVPGAYLLHSKCYVNVCYYYFICSIQKFFQEDRLDIICIGKVENVSPKWLRSLSKIILS